MAWSELREGGAMTANGSGTKDDPWQLSTPPGTSDYQMYRDEANTPPRLVCVVGSTTLYYDLRAIDDLHTMLKDAGDWIPLGSADENKPAKDGTVEAWGRAEDNPVGGWYGLRKGYRGRFGMYMPPLLEALGLAELEHQPRNNRMRAL
jgi:hypothetical protein